MENIFVEQLKKYIAEYDSILKQSQYDDGSDVFKDHNTARIQTQALAAIDRIAGKDSVYYEQAQIIINNTNHKPGKLQEIIGIARGLLGDLEAGYLKSLAEIVHSELFSDYLEMAKHLLDSGYKDAAAVIAGSTLEAHLKQLALKFNIAVENNNGKPKKADTINADLVKAGAYNKLDQKNVTAWLDLRNKAAHGDYSEYGQEEVKLLLDNIRSFIGRNPA